MTTSVGENEITCGNYRIGKARILGFHAAQAIYPRLTILAGISLHDVAEEPSAPKELKASYWMADITGELRLKEMQEVVAPIFWTGHKQFVRATTRGHEEQVTLACDLDFQRIELIERWRDAKPPTFWIQLWPVLMSRTGERLDWAEVRSFQMRVTREAWGDFYSQVGGGKFDVIEVQYSAKEAEQFKTAIRQVQKAREQIFNGDNDGAVLTCRKALEAILRELPRIEGKADVEGDSKDSPLRTFFNMTTDEKRAEGYAGIVSKLKVLMNIAAHGVSARVLFTRDEAQFVLRTTEALLALLGRLGARP